jgi:hypothetical protein
MGGLMAELQLDGPLMTSRDQVRAAVARSRERGRIALIMVDHLKIPTRKGSRLVRTMLAELTGQVSLVYTPAYDPDANRIEWHGPHLTSCSDT